MSSFLYPSQRPKILLINFEEADFISLQSKGFNIERGWATGSYHYFPSPGYEYDIVIARYDKAGYDASRVLSHSGEDNDDYDHLYDKVNGAGFALVFTPTREFSNDDISSSGIQGIELTELDPRDTKYEVFNVVPERIGVPFVKGLLKRFSSDIITPVHFGLDGRGNVFTPILLNGNNQVISSIGYSSSQKWNQDKGASEDIYSPHCILLPAFQKGYGRITLEVLNELPSWRPDLFTEDTGYAWFDADAYLPNEAKNLKGAIDEEEKRFEGKVIELQAAYNGVLNEDHLIRQLLVADDSDEFPEGSKLTDAVEWSLSFLGFEVQNNEKVLSQGKRREDLVCIDPLDGYVALVECKGAVGTNPPERHAFQLLNHMQVKKVEKGILALNHNRKADAFSRSLPYEDASHIWEDVQGLTILSTVELFKLVRKVQVDEITKEEARSLIKLPGRFTIV